MKFPIITDKQYAVMYTLKDGREASIDIISKRLKAVGLKLKNKSIEEILDRLFWRHFMENYWSSNSDKEGYKLTKKGGQALNITKKFYTNI